LMPSSMAWSWRQDRPRGLSTGQPGRAQKSPAPARGRAGLPEGGV